MCTRRSANACAHHAFHVGVTESTFHGQICLISLIDQCTPKVITGGCYSMCMWPYSLKSTAAVLLRRPMCSVNIDTMYFHSSCRKAGTSMCDYNTIRAHKLWASEQWPAPFIDIDLSGPRVRPAAVLGRFRHSSWPWPPHHGWGWHARGRHYRPHRHSLHNLVISRSHLQIIA